MHGLFIVYQCDHSSFFSAHSYVQSAAYMKIKVAPNYDGK